MTKRRNTIYVYHNHDLIYIYTYITYILWLSTSVRQLLGARKITQTNRVVPSSRLACVLTQFVFFKSLSSCPNGSATPPRRSFFDCLLGSTEILSFLSAGQQISHELPRSLPRKPINVDALLKRYFSSRSSNILYCVRSTKESCSGKLMPMRLS